MEVVSPLTFPRAGQSGKRRCSPLLGASDIDMDDCPGYAFPVAKRRKRHSNSNGGDGLAPPALVAPLAAVAASFRPPACDAGSPPARRGEAAHKLRELQRVVAQQAAEIQRLKGAHAAAHAKAEQGAVHHAKAEQENKILKRAVVVQQERQGQLAGELEGARRYRTEAEERIRRLEQMNRTLQYQLQAQSTAGNDFMGFSRRPPDVY